MPKLSDYDCNQCGHRFEHTCMSADEVVSCPLCGDLDVRARLGGRPFHVIVPMHRTSLRSKAGYVHTHGDRPAERGSVAMPNKDLF